MINRKKSRDLFFYKNKKIITKSYKYKIPIDKVPILNINLTNNNCIMTFYKKNKLIITYSIGHVGYKNSQKSSNVAHNLLTKKISKFLQKKNYKTFIIKFNGLKRFKRTIIQELAKFHFNIIKIIDDTPLIHNGCRKKKKKR